MFRFVGWMVLGALVSAPHARSEEAITAGKIDAVTVYRGEALVTRIVEVPGEAGLREVVVTDLPLGVQPESIFAEAEPGVAVRSIRYRVRPVAEDVREEVRALDRQLQETQAKIEMNGKLKLVIEQDRQFLSKLENFTAPAATTEMSKGVLQPATIEAVTRFLASERHRLAEEEHRLGIEAAELAQKMDLLQRERQTLAAGAAKTVREAIVFVDSQNPGGKFRLRYLVGNATWSPSYNLRASAGSSEVTIEYNASIQQSSGEDWPEVGMTLSTATPSLVARAPVLTGISINLQSIVAQSDSPRAEEQESSRRAITAELKKAETLRNKAAAEPQQQAANAGPRGQQAGQLYYDRSLNELAANLQALDLDLAHRDRKTAAEPTPSDEGASVTYDLPGRITMPSRSDQQLVQIASTTMKGEFAKVATPLLTEFVYNEAALVNDGAFVLLAGPASSFVDGKFVGQGSVPTVAVGERFAVGFGIDLSLKCRREVIEESEKSQGGNRVLDLSYRLVVENFGPEAATVRIIDRIPTAKESEVKVSLVSPETDLSQDAEYLASQRKKGILRWDVEVPASTFGSKAKSVKYAFRMEFDKNLRIGGAVLN